MIQRLDLHALADGELDKGEAKLLREALRDDPQAQAEYEVILNFKEMVVQQSVRHEAEDCWKACQVRMNEIDRSRRVESFVGRYAWAMCAVFFVLILGSRFMVNDVRGASARTADLG
jgi:anti-sigma factor RsiW